MDSKRWGGERDHRETARGGLVAGENLGPYRIDAALGAGGMGEVYRAFDTRLHRTVAIKVLPRDRLKDQDRKRRLLQEARAASALTHPNIVTLHDICSDRDIDFLVLEYVPGQTLDRLIPPKGLGIARTLDYAAQIANALSAAHAAGIVHRDIKPGNVIVTPESQVKVLDFGLAKLADQAAINPESVTRTAEPSLTREGIVMGTAAYMSPEQARGEKVDARTDLFSLGAVIYEMAAGRRAFLKPLDWTLPTSTGVHPELDRITFKLLEPTAELRYQTAADVIADLKRLQRTLESGPTSRRYWLAAASVSVLTVVLAAALIWVWTRRQPPGENRPVQLTNLPDSVSQAALSPDGRMLTFIRGPSTFFTPGQIYVKMLPDGEPVQLTRDNSLKMSPVFSPDGSRIAYTVVPFLGTAWETWVVPVLGGEPRLWLPNASGLVWVDRKNLLFSEFKNPLPHLAIVAADENRVGPRDLYVPANIGMAHRSYASPSGKWVVVVEMNQQGEWLPCRLLPIDGSSRGRQVGPLGAECTFSAWSPDEKWIYLSSKAGGTFHTWRQRFPGGQPEQVTSGATEDEGIAMAPDGRSFITAMALKQSSIWMHDSNGDRQISLEGYAFQPKLSPNGRRLYYRILKSGSISSAFPEREPTELWVAELESGRIEALLPSFPIFGRLAYDISPDGQQLVVSTLDGEGKSRVWIAPVDRRSPPRQIPNVEGAQPIFGPPGEIFFHAGEGNSGFAYRVREDGTGLRKAIDQPVVRMQGVSRDGRYLVVFQSSGETGATLAFPLDGAPPVRIFPGIAFLKWSPQGKFLLITPGLAASATKSYVIALPADQALPQFPAGGVKSNAEFTKLPGARVIDFGDVAPGPTPDVYAYSRETVQRNLYRVPIP